MLSAKGLIQHPDSSKETIDGVRQVRVGDKRAFMEQLKPKYNALPDYQEKVLTSLNLQAKDVSDEALLVNTGNSFLVIGVKDKQTLADIKPNYDLIQTISEELDLIGYYVFSLDTYLDSSAATSRMFGPRYGILEEAATGMAAGPLACYLFDYTSLKQTPLMIEQGFAMTPASPSLLEAELTVVDDQIQSLTVGGSAKVSRHLFVEL